MINDNSRQGILKRLRAKVARGAPIIGGGAGTGLSAKFEEAGGIDLIVIYNSGRFRMAGRGSMAGTMPFGNANEIVVEMAREVLPVVKHTPVLAGVCATDPFILPRVFLQELKRIGFAGIQNFPTVGLIDGNYRLNLEETGFSYAKEVEMVALARELEMFTSPYVFNPEEARAMTRAGADIVVAHMGTTKGGTIGAHSVKTLDDCVKEIDAIAAAARKERPDVLLICHGGPIAEPADAAQILERCPMIHGFYGASSMERLPAERAIQAQTEAFTCLTLARPKSPTKRKQ
ncbi:MAG TPA: phosphoenolpyruvate hydrolase family protein [Planctomycetota bacterium]|nr:phosphoenolpyruvate hydrolase family protein [Planctomycetota bacterium]